MCPSAPQLAFPSTLPLCARPPQPAPPATMGKKSKAAKRGQAEAEAEAKAQAAATAPANKAKEGAALDELDLIFQAAKKPKKGGADKAAAPEGRAEKAKEKEREGKEATQKKAKKLKKDKAKASMAADEDGFSDSRGLRKKSGLKAAEGEEGERERKEEGERERGEWVKGRVEGAREN